MFVAKSNVPARTVSTIVDYMACHADVSVKLLDRQGRIISANRIALENFGKSQEEICGLHWPAIWTGGNRAAIDHAIAQSLDGKPSQIEIDAQMNGSHWTWDIEVFPCEWENGQVVRILVLSRPVAKGMDARDATEGDEVMSVLRQTLHSVANLSAAAVGAANLLRRGLSEERRDIVATSLEESGHAAARALRDLKNLFNPELDT